MVTVEQRAAASQTLMQTKTTLNLNFKKNSGVIWVTSTPGFSPLMIKAHSNKNKILTYLIYSVSDPNQLDESDPSVVDSFIVLRSACQVNAAILPGTNSILTSTKVVKSWPIEGKQRREHCQTTRRVVISKD